MISVWQSVCMQGLTLARAIQFVSVYVPIVEKAATEHHIPFKAIHIGRKEAAQNAPTPITTYALFCDGQHLILEPHKNL